MRVYNCPKCTLEVDGKSICCDVCNNWYHLDCTTLTKFEFRTHTINKYKTWKCEVCVDKYCNKCGKTFSMANINSICCDRCSQWYHQTCTDLTTSEFNQYSENVDKIWKCKSCIGKYCKKCNITTHHKDKLSCNLCNNIYHLKCSGLTKDRFNEIKNKKDTWKCRDCYSNIFPFHQIDNNKLESLQDIKVKQNTKITMNTENYSKWCAVCDKKVLQPQCGLPCNSCKKIIHKKCSKLSKNDIKIFHLFHENWQCLACTHEKFPFAHIENNELHHIAFNSNFVYKKLSHKIMVDDNLKLLLTQTNNNSRNYNFDIENEFEVNVEIKPNFKYYEIQEFRKMKDTLKKQKHLSIFHTNICSLNANVENMENLIHDLDFKFDILTVTETWNPEITKVTFSPKLLEGYHAYYGTTGSSAKGGCGVYVNELLNPIPRKDLEFKINENSHESESCWVELINNKGPNTLLGTFYRHPSKQDSTFNENLKKVLQKLKKESSKKIIICGDFNQNLLNYDKDEYISTFLNTMLENGFQPCITEPTRITNTNKPSLVDNIFINTIENPISGNILEHISYDHLPNFVILEHGQVNKNIKIKTRNMKNFNQNDFQNELLNPSLIHQIENAKDTNSAFNAYKKKFCQTINKHAPLRFLNKKEIKLRQKPWLTKGILISIKIKRTL